MAYSTGFVTDASMLAHYAMLKQIRDFAVANGWTELRYDTASANRELILKGTGLSGTEEIFVGFRTYQDATADYYNLVAATFTGYISGNTFDTQPGAMLSGVPAHNSRIDYWLAVNGQRIILAMKVGTPVYESCYVGKFLPYAAPSHMPYPVVCGGMLAGAAATRFSDTAHSMPYKGNRDNMRARLNDGSWLKAYCHPWITTSYQSIISQMRDTNGNYGLFPIVLHDGSGNVYGELDGVFAISGFDNAVQNTLSIGGKTYVVIQDTYRTGFADYYAMRLD